MSTTLKTRSLGKQLKVGEIGLGCMGMSEFYGETDAAQSLKTLHRAADLGVTMFDTADMYGSGANEELVASFLHERGRDAVKVATKFAFIRDAFDYAPENHNGVSNDPAYARRACEASLKRLGVDHIDLYYVHRVEPGRPIEEVMGALADLVKEGKISQIGLSEVSGETLRRAHAVAPVAAVQSEYSLWSREPEADILGVCEELGVGFVAYSPLGRGFLTGNFSVDSLDADDWRRTNPRFTEEAIAKNKQMATDVKAFAEQKDCSPAQLLLAWVLAKRPFIVPIPGTKRISYLEDNLGAAQVSLTQDEVKALDQLAPFGAAAGDRYSDLGMALLAG